MSTNRQQLKQQKRKLRHNRVRKTTVPKTDRLRLAVFRSATHIYAQIIDDKAGKTLVSSSSTELKGKSAKTDSSTAVGKSVAEKAVAKGISKVVFDRGGYRYHGRVKALAEAARAGGLEF